MARKLPTDWRSRRKRVFERDNLRCWNCGRYHGMSGMTLHAHHIRPRERGGTHKVRNLVTVCDRAIIKSTMVSFRTLPTKILSTGPLRRCTALVGRFKSEWEKTTSSRW
ncbi:HNH endonuclease [Natronosalvus hydrolyticus]|uniref:HNH endonuclease n=1 Tax=Natronosalvus hydrolyticus TaxID=2979988 RepID=UPI003CCC6B4A